MDEGRLGAERLNARVSELAMAADGLKAELQTSLEAQDKAASQHRKLHDAIKAVLVQEHDMAGSFGCSPKHEPFWNAVGFLCSMKIVVQH